jgi:hypothetical protein
MQICGHAPYVTSTDIAGAWVELAAANAEQYGYLLQIGTNMGYTIRGDYRIFFAHANCFMNDGVLYDNPGLNYLRICDELFAMAGGRVAWLPADEWGATQMRDPVRNEWY